MEIDRENSRSFDDSTAIRLEEGVVEELKTSMMVKLRRNSPLPASCCIFKVPQLIRSQKEQSYVPDVVSIGPYHRSPGGKFQLIENVKWWYLYIFLSMADVELESLIKDIMEFEKRARDCYAEPLDHLNHKDFLEMLILDGCFLIVLFLNASPELQNKDSPFDLTFKMACTRNGLFRPDSNVDPTLNMTYRVECLRNDLLLLENQLPWFVLMFLYDKVPVKLDEGNASLIELVVNFFSYGVSIKGDWEVLHILDLIRTALVDNFQVWKSQGEDEGPSAAKKVFSSIYVKAQNVLKCPTLGPKWDGAGPHQQQQKTGPDILWQRIPNATALLEAGVGFKKSVTPTKQLGIDFKNGVLSIPTLEIREGTGPLLRNLIAFEQCYHSNGHMLITSYVFLMDSLIDTSKDIEILCERGILRNWLSAEDASKFFNDLYNGTAAVEFCFRELCHDVNKHYNIKWHKWMAKLRHDYFSTPWAVISFIAAVILLALTSLQTAYTIHPGP